MDQALLFIHCITVVFRISDSGTLSCCARSHTHKPESPFVIEIISLSMTYSSKSYLKIILVIISKVLLQCNFKLKCITSRNKSNSANVLKDTNKIFSSAYLHKHTHMLCNYILFQDPPKYFFKNGDIFAWKMYGYLLIEMLCERFRKLLFYYL